MHSFRDDVAIPTILYYECFHDELRDDVNLLFLTSPIRFLVFRALMGVIRPRQ